MDIIYLLRDSIGLYKIGFTKDLNKRLKSLHTACSTDLEIIATFQTKHKRKVETSLHNRFNYKRVNREFFDLTYEDEINFLKICETIEKAFDTLKMLK